MSADAHGHEKGHESKGSPIEKGVSWLVGGFAKLALAFGILVGSVVLAQAAVPMVAAAATSFFSGSVVLPNYMFAGAIAAGVVAGNQMGKGKEAPKKKEPAAHGAAHH